MSNKIDIDESYQPDEFEEIDEAKYKKNHCFPNGSTIILDRIRHTIYKNTTSEELQTEIYIYISKTYANIIKNNHINIIIESKNTPQRTVIPYVQFFDDENCIPFTISYKLYYLQNDDGVIKLICSNNNNIYQEYEYDEKTKKDKLIKCDSINKLISDGYKLQEQINIQDKWCIEIDTTFVMFSKRIKTSGGYEELPKASTEIFKDGRLYGVIKNFGISQDGYKNHVLHSINFKSKKIGKELGMTCNKYITFTQDNNLIKLIRKIILLNQVPFTNNRKTIIYKKIFDTAVKAKLEKTKDPDFKPLKLDEKKQISDDENDDNKTNDNEEKEFYDDFLILETVNQINEVKVNIITDKKMSDTKLSDTKLSDTKLNDTKLSYTKSSDTKTNDTKLSDIKSSNTKSNDIKIGNNILSDKKESNTKLSDKKTPGIIKSKFNKKEESKYEVSKGINQYFYLIQTKENIGTNIYKIGKTEQYNPNDRLKEYVSGYVIHMIIKVEKASNFEENIIIRFKEIFEQSKREYFEGDINIMNSIIAKLWINECN
jgi:hypothetical protein